MNFYQQNYCSFMICCSHTLLCFIYTVLKLKNSKTLLYFVQLTLCMCELNCSIVSNTLTPWMVAHQSAQSMEYFRQEYWSGFHGVLPLMRSHRVRHNWVSTHMHNANCTKVDSIFEFLSLNTVYIKYSNVSEQYIMKLQWFYW